MKTAIEKILAAHQLLETLNSNEDYYVNIENTPLVQTIFPLSEWKFFMANNWKTADRGDLKRYQIIARMLERYPNLLAYLFHPTKPELAAPPKELLQNPYSAGEKILLKIAIALWTGDGGITLLELNRLDAKNFVGVVNGLIAFRNL